MARGQHAATLLLVLALTAARQAQARVQLLTGAAAPASKRHQHQHPVEQQQQQPPPRRLQQYTGGTVAAAAQDPCAARPCANGGQCVPNGVSYVCACGDGWGGAFCTQPTASVGGSAAGAGSSYQLTGAVPTPTNPAVGEVDRAMATGQAPNDIADFKAKAWLRGRVLGQRVTADGAARGSVGHNELGGITGVAEASGQFESDGRFGYYAGAGAARAAAASAASEYGDGAGGRTTVLQGAAAAEASGSLYGRLPVSGTEVEAAGSASAQAQGSIVVRRPANAIY